MQAMAVEQENTTVLNRNIELFLSSNSSLEIDEQFGRNALANYLAELALISSGVPFSELGFSERRAALLPSIIPFSADNFNQFATVQNLDNRQSVLPGSIAVLKLAGVMRSQDGLSSYGADTVTGWLRSAYNNPNIDGVIIETETGGGEAMAGTKIDNVISERNKPVIGFAHMAASAGYRALSNADEIIGAGTASQFGSIGVMIALNKKRIEDTKASMDFIYGDATPNKNGADRALMNGDLGPMKEYINNMTAEFHQQVIKARDLQGRADIKETLSGSMFGAMDAKKRGLIDMVGNMQTAVKRVRALKSKYK